MKASTFMATLERLDMASSYNRMRTSDNNPYSESLFRTLKHWPAFPTYGFESLNAVKLWTYRYRSLKHVPTGERY